LLGRAPPDQPGDVWVNYNLARLLEQLHPPRTEEAIRFYSVARGLRPETAHELAHALERRGRGDEAVVVFRDLTGRRSGNGRHWGCLGQLLKERGDRAGSEAALAKAVAALRETIRLKPDLAVAHTNLGLALLNQGKLDEAIAESREAIRLRPEYVWDHYNLGLGLNAQGKQDEALAAFRAAIRLQPEAEAHINLGRILRAQGKREEALAAFRAAVRLKPDLAVGHANLGLELSDHGKLAEAIAENREAIRLQPDYLAAHTNLADDLKSLGDFAAAAEEFRKARDLAGSDPERRLPGIGRELTATERLAALAPRLPAVLRGHEKPKDVVEGLDFGKMASIRKRYSISARLFAAAFQADPKLADDVAAEYRYNAARAAAMAGAGQGDDKPPLDEPEKARWRKQALDWLKADLVFWTKQDQTGMAEAKALVSQTLGHWKADADLAGIRDPDALAKLPENEQTACRDFWADVEALLKRAEGRTP
jgi:tetratricopeptide (TPR) repeat protein